MTVSHARDPFLGRILDTDVDTQGGEGATNELVSKAYSQEAMSTLWKRRGRSLFPHHRQITAICRWLLASPAPPRQQKAESPANSRRMGKNSARKWAMPPSLVLAPPLAAIL